MNNNQKPNLGSILINLHIMELAYAEAMRELRELREENAILRGELRDAQLEASYTAG